MAQRYAGRFGSTFIGIEDSARWDSTLYSPLREFYRDKNLTGGGTLVVGCGHGLELPAGFSGTFIDLNTEAVANAAKLHTQARAVNANALALPFQDMQFDSVVLSLILSQLQRTGIGGRKGDIGDSIAAYDEACRVMKEDGRLFVIDTVSRTTTLLVNGREPFTESKEYFDIGEVIAGSWRSAGEVGGFVWVQDTPLAYVPSINAELAPEGRTGVEYDVAIFELKRN